MATCQQAFRAQSGRLWSETRDIYILLVICVRGVRGKPTQDHILGVAHITKVLPWTECPGWAAKHAVDKLDFGEMPFTTVLHATCLITYSMQGPASQNWC